MPPLAVTTLGWFAFIRQREADRPIENNVYGAIAVYAVSGVFLEDYDLQFGMAMYNATRVAANYERKVIAASDAECVRVIRYPFCASFLKIDDGGVPPPDDFDFPGRKDSLVESTTTREADNPS